MKTEINIDGVIYVRKEKQEKLLPFDIEKAKAGAKVVTRDGRDVVIYDYSLNDPNNSYVIAGRYVIAGKVIYQSGSERIGAWTRGGEYSNIPLKENPEDLFLLNPNYQGE